MICSLQEILSDAKKNTYAVGSFNTPNLEALIAVIAAAEECAMPVIISHAQVHESLISLDVIGEIMVSHAKRAKVPVCVHLDHGEDIDYLEKAMKIGFTSVMYDGSVLPYEENVVNCHKAVQIAKTYGVDVEGELGRLSHPETGSGQETQEGQSMYTDPAQAKQFVDQTGVAALAIAFGTAHGMYTTPPVLDLDRVALIAQQVETPLVMHGGSGVGESGFRRAIQNGISKINYYTYMALAGGNGVQKMLQESTKPCYFHDVALCGIEAMKKDAFDAMQVFGKRG